MAMMAKMRSLAPAFIITVGALFVLFMIISDSNVLEGLGARTNNLGSVNGEDITYTEFSNYFDQQIQAQKNQLGRELTEEEIEQIREQSWETMVTQKLIAEQIDEMNIVVTDEEIKEAILGDNPPDFLKQNFIDSTGQFNRALYDQALLDPRNREPVLQAEEIVRQTRLSEKLQSMISASVTVSEQEVKQRFMDQNMRMSAQYALVDINKIPDSEVEATDSDLKDYFNKNISNYTIKPQRKLKYVIFPTSPSADDTANVIRALENVAANLKRDTASFSYYVDIYSSEPLSQDTVSVGDLSSEGAEQLMNAQPGTVVGPVPSSSGYALYNLVKRVPSSEPVANVSHILINQFGTDEKNLEQANQIYERAVKGEDFSKLASQYSTDPGSAAKGGDLGWFGRGAMVPEFEKASFEGKVGIVQKPVKSSYGYHIILVKGRTTDKFVVEKIVNNVETSATTKEAMSNAARDFEYLADKNGFEKEAELMKYNVQETAPFVEESFSIPGIGVNKNLLSFAFSSDVDDVSPVHRIPNGYVVAKVSEVIKEGAQEFDKIKDQLKPAVIREKKMEKAKTIAADLSKKVGNDLSKASELNPYVIVDTSGSFTAAGSIKGIGRDYAFAAKAQVLDLNKVSEPIKGSRGYFLIKVTERTPFDQTVYDMQKDGMRESLLQEKRSSFFSQWLVNLRKEADVVDNRHMFYGY
jgi:peptidyl-prolyl cis-trans isomerase D